MNPTFLNIDDFVEEVKRWVVPNSSNKTRIRSMIKGDNYHFRFFIPDSSEAIETVIEKSQYNFYKLELGPLSVGAIWEDESEEIKDLSKKLEVINAKQMESKKYVVGIIAVLSLAALYNFVPEPTDTHTCIVNGTVEMSMKCNRLSLTGKTCYPNEGTRKGSKLCGEEWLRIDRTDIIEISEKPYKTSKKGFLCSTQNCTPFSSI